MEDRIKIGDVWYVREEQPIEEIEMDIRAGRPKCQFQFPATHT